MPSVHDCQIDKVHALGAASIGVSIGADAIHFIDALQPKSYYTLLDGLVKSASKRFKCERSMLEKLCALVIKEAALKSCLTCLGAKEVMAGERKITCQTCGGSGLHRHTDRERAAALGLSEETYLKGWNDRLETVQVLFSGKYRNIVKLTSKKYYVET